MAAAGGKKGRVLGLKAGNPENKIGHAKLGRSLGIYTKVPKYSTHPRVAVKLC